MDKPGYIVVDPSLDFDDGSLREFVAKHAIPGETVRLSPGTKFQGEPSEAATGRVATFGDRLQTVAELRLDRKGDGAILNYRFEGVEGLYPARAFTNPEGYEHFYGVVIHRDGQAWMVPLDPKSEPGVPRAAGEPMRIANEMSRCGRYFFGLPDPVLAAYGQEHGPDRSVEEFLAEYEARPADGEFDLSPMPDGTWRLDASGWGGETEPAFVTFAEEAIAAHAHRPGPR